MNNVICPLCASKNTEVTPEGYYHLHFGWVPYLCKDCGALFGIWRVEK